MVAYSTSKGSAIKFQHVTAAVNVRMRNEISGKTLVLDRVKVSSSAYKLSGTARVTLASGAAPTIGTQSGSGSVTVTFAEGYTIAYNAIRDVQVPILPIGNEGNLTVDVLTHDSDNPNIEYIFSHTVAASGLNGGAGLPRNVMLTAGCLINTSDGHHVIEYNYIPLPTPLTFEAKEAGATVTFSSDYYGIQYSRNGVDWITYTSAITLENIGDKVSFRGENITYSNDDYEYDYSYFSCSADCYIYGNIMSLVDSTKYPTVTELSNVL